MSALDSYIALDLREGSSLSAALGQGLSAEAGRPSGDLTSEFARDHLPAHLTPFMAAWYARDIQSVRRAALTQIRGEMNARRMPGDQPGMLYEYERENAILRARQQIQSEIEVMKQDARLSGLLDNFRRAEAGYEKFRQQHGRDAVDWNGLSYYFVLGGIAVPEFMINWESFQKIPYLQNFPLLAIGSIVIVAFFFAFSSHIIGVLLKQGQDWFGGGVKSSELRRNIMIFVGAILLFFIAFGIITWGRVLLVQSMVVDALERTGTPRSGWDLVTTYGGALLGNLGVFLAGTLWSSLRHDPVAGFVELRFKRDSLQRRLADIYNRKIKGRAQRHLLRSQREIEKIHQRELQQEQLLPNYNALRQSVSALIQKDAQVTGLLKDYRFKLIGALQASDPQPSFRILDPSKIERGFARRVSLDEFRTMPIELPFTG